MVKIPVVMLIIQHDSTFLCQTSLQRAQCAQSSPYYGKIIERLHLALLLCPQLLTNGRQSGRVAGDEV